VDEGEHAVGAPQQGVGHLDVRGGDVARLGERQGRAERGDRLVQRLGDRLRAGRLTATGAADDRDDPAHGR
jgi:hypothetical protein